MFKVTIQYQEKHPLIPDHVKTNINNYNSQYVLMEIATTASKAILNVIVANL